MLNNYDDRTFDSSDTNSPPPGTSGFGIERIEASDDGASGNKLGAVLLAAGYTDGEVFELCSIVKCKTTKSANICSDRFVVSPAGLSTAQRWTDEQVRALPTGSDFEGGIYLASNPLRNGKGRASDADVVLTRVLLIDVDPVDSSELARTEAAKVATEVVTMVRERLGVSPTAVDSGRGQQIWLLHEDLDQSSELRERLIAGLAARFDSAAVKIDRSVHNPSRLMRLPGTPNLKTGDLARLTRVGDGGRAPLDQVHQLAEDLQAGASVHAVTLAMGPKPGSVATPLPPLPLDVFPPLLSDVLQAFARGTQASVELAALPAMAVLATALGPRWRVGPPGYVRAPLLWFAAVAPSGSGKTPAAIAAMKPIERLDIKLREEFESARRAFEAAKKAKVVDGLVEPRRRRLIMTEATIEAVASELAAADGHGLLLHSDEIATLLLGLDRYTKNSRAGAKAWLSIYNGQIIRITRKKAEDSREADRPHLCVYGGVQPSVVGQLGLQDSDGLLARFLWSVAPTFPHGLGAGVDDYHAARWQRAVHLAVGHRIEQVQQFDPDAAELLDDRIWSWTTEANRLEAANMSLTASIYGKGPEHLVRLTALLHGMALIDEALRDDYEQLAVQPVGAAVVRRALRLVDYFLAHGVHTARLAYGSEGETDQPSEHDDRVAMALRSTLRPGEHVKDTPSGWCARLSAAGIQLSADELGRRFTRLEVSPPQGLAVERLPRRDTRGWAVTRLEDA